MTLSNQEDISDFINNIENLIDSMENKENPSFETFCKNYGYFDNFVDFKKTYFNFLRTTNQELINKLNDEQTLISFWMKNGFFHESLLKQFQQRFILKSILKKVADVTIDFLRKEK